jgi:hypothetical protein
VLNGEWTNEFNPRDVNGDGGVVPIDVLIGINQLNARTVVEADGRLPDRTLYPTAPFWDTNGDGFLVPSDMLVIINALNKDEAPPTITVRLVNDTGALGATNADQVTADSMISGVITDDLTGFAWLAATVDDGAARSIAVERSGAFEFDPGLALDSSQDGTHQITLHASDGTRHIAVFEFVFQFDNTPPRILIESASHLAASNNFTVTGRVLDNLSGVTRLKVQLDGEPSTTLPFDIHGNFMLSTTLAVNGSTDGPRQLSFTATDAAGLESTESLSFTLAQSRTLAVALDATNFDGKSELSTLSRAEAYADDFTAVDSSQAYTFTAWGRAGDGQGNQYVADNRQYYDLATTTCTSIACRAGVMTGPTTIGPWRGTDIATQLVTNTPITPTRAMFWSMLGPLAAWSPRTTAFG